MSSCTICSRGVSLLRTLQTLIRELEQVRRFWPLFPKGVLIDKES
ncbi:predicted protein [Sclerotinia sclerotiorum 1980 UF-70]|uniref:Uncharacterized protein n=1 Tax=Sclerotinia sclerotiorum (strain ATCC 18683 / 1980 / Ss-1) TaxID=665079 RepID=A7F896_SCLS1|nr:predicted protein [Sclerotinia sclerotiorum 1980 UF-70]EDN98967.1 predicted protein [Sclerotinia sclerotiorum 1980 UF-70]